MARTLEVFDGLRKLRAASLPGIVAVAAITLSAQTPTILHSFVNTDGANPFAGVIQASDGNFYGTTYSGGNFVNGAGNGNGVVFQVTPTGTFTAIYAFCAQVNCPDGALPVGNLVQATDGNLYGTTAAGGANNRGTVFSITTSGTLTTLYSFCSQDGCADGSLPYAGLIQASDGNFYGTTKFGGSNSFGTVFRVTAGGALTTLYSFCPQTGCPDGARPNAVLVQGSDGNLYGTTLEGGSGGYGAVFQITTGGALTTLYSFCSQTGCPDGASPVGGLIQASNGKLYGTTELGGANNNNGTVYSITTAGSLTTIYSFCAQAACSDGQNPSDTLVQATDGNLYGTTNSGGIGYGTIFKIATAGALTTLYSFPNPGAGSEPFAGLFQASNGTFYGTTFIGGAHGYGEVYSFAAQGAVPNVVGFTQAAATTAITGAGLVVGTVTMTSSASVPAGEVISQNPTSGMLVNLGSSVDLVISTGSVSLLPQTITFNAIPTQVQGKPLTLIASASSGLPVMFASSTPLICSVNGNTATLASAGTCTIVASQPGNAMYAAANPVSRSFTVQPAFTIVPTPGSQTIILGNTALVVVQVRSTTGFNGLVTVSCADGPPRSTCSVFPPMVGLSGGYGATFATIVLSQNTSRGTYTFTFKGVSGAISNSASETITKP